MLYLVRVITSVFGIFYLHELSHMYNIYLNLLLQIMSYGLCFMIIHFSLWYLTAKNQRNTIEENMIKTVITMFNQFKIRVSTFLQKE
jgi:hypothetical protein